MRRASLRRTTRLPVDDDDEVLARAAAAGDRRSLEVLLDRHLGLVHAVCRRVVANEQDALDATQEALIAVARGIGGFEGSARFTTWLHRVAVNAALQELRRRGRRPPVATEEAAERVAEGGGPERRVVARLDVDAALGALAEEYRAAIVLREIHDLDYADIARILDVPIGTVRSRLARGRAQLVEMLS